jgi:phosphatidylethanolamine/phosphatidyl-N-methylethanolamine N-methyltransferase
MDLQDTLKTYRLFSGSYDFVFGPVFHPGRKEAVRIVNDRPGQHILEVGVGTGLSLPFFRKDAKVTGIDVSTEMLEKARRRVARRQLAQVEALVEMDAENLSFPDDSFDSVLALYVASVVPDPARFAAEMRRKIGFHADFPLADFLAASRLDVRETRPSNLCGYWRLLRCVNNKPHSRSA